MCDENKVGVNQTYAFVEKNILIANIGGKIYATDLMCTHAEADLSYGDITNSGLKCPLHESVFELESGCPLNPPATKPLKKYNVKIENNSIFVEV